MFIWYCMYIQRWCRKNWRLHSAEHRPGENAVRGHGRLVPDDRAVEDTATRHDPIRGTRRPTGWSMTSYSTCVTVYFLLHTSMLVVRCTRLSTIGDWAFPVSAARLWNTLPLNVTSASPLSVCRKQFKTRLFSHSFPESPVVSTYNSAVVFISTFYVYACQIKSSQTILLCAQKLTRESWLTLFCRT